MARREASLPHTAVDTAITMTRGGDKLRTICGRLRWNPAECGSTKAAISAASALGGISGHPAHTVCAGPVLS